MREEVWGAGVVGGCWCGRRGVVREGRGAGGVLQESTRVHRVDQHKEYGRHGGGRHGGAGWGAGGSERA